MAKALYHRNLENGSFAWAVEGEHHDGRPSLRITYRDVTVSPDHVTGTFYYPIGTSSDTLYREAKSHMQLVVYKLIANMFEVSKNRGITPV